MSRISTIQNPSNVDANQKSSFPESLKNSILFRNLVKAALLIAPIACLSGCPGEGEPSVENRPAPITKQATRPKPRKSTGKKSPTNLMSFDELLNNSDKIRRQVDADRKQLEEVIKDVER